MQAPVKYRLTWPSALASIRMVASGSGLASFSPPGDGSTIKPAGNTATSHKRKTCFIGLSPRSEDERREHGQGVRRSVRAGRPVRVILSAACSCGEKRQTCIVADPGAFPDVMDLSAIRKSGRGLVVHCR